MTEAPVGDAAATALQQPLKRLAAASVGNIFESYDLLVYAFVANHLGNSIFGGGSTPAGLMAAFAVFGAGLLVRPFGGWVLGRVGDRIGRRPALLLSLMGMAGGTVGIGLLPTFAQVGILSPLLLILLRCVQGFCAGGEWGLAATYIVESAPPGRRGVFGSVGQASNYASTIFAGGIVAILSEGLGPDRMAEWGWRVAFLIGGLLIPVAIWLRRRLPETEAFVTARDKGGRDDSAIDAGVAWAIIRTFGLTMIFTASSYVLLAYLPTFTVRYTGLSEGAALACNSAALVLAVVGTVGFGRLSDRIGRRLPLVFGCAGLALCSYPLFTVIAQPAPVATVLAVQLVFNLFVGAVSGPTVSALVELFTARTRVTGLSLGYTVSTIVFGGFAPFIVTWLIEALDTPTAPALLLILCAVASGTVALTMKETAFAPLD